MIIYPICSSSKGNCLFVKKDDVSILIDAGTSFKNLVNCLKAKGFSEKTIKAVFITHEHSDHVKGLYSITRFLKVPVYSCKETLKELIVKNNIFKGTKLFEINKKTAKISPFFVSAFRVFHDSVGGVRFKVFDGEKNLAVCTDLGEVNLNIVENLKTADFVFLEANYDEKMLREGKYPYILKKRIASKYGHLSNLDAARLMEVLLNFGVKKFLLGHLSLKNNMPQIALKTVISYLITKNKKYLKDYEVYLASEKNSSLIFKI